MPTLKTNINEIIHSVSHFLVYHFKSYVIMEVNDIIRSVSRSTKISIKQMKSRTRLGPVHEARQIAMHLIYENIPGITLKEVGSIFNRHYSTALVSIRTITNIMEVDKVHRGKVNRIIINVLSTNK